MTTRGVSRIHELRDLARQHLQRFRTETAVFAFVFLDIATSFRPGTSSGSNGNNEQWMNLLNATFYGHQDFLFSYGPLFWLTGAAPTAYSQAAFWASVLFVASTNGLFWALLTSACRRSRSLIYLAAAYFFVFAGLLQRDVLLYLPATAVACLDFSASRDRLLTRRVITTAGVVVGFLFYVRFMFGFVALATLAAYLVGRGRSSRRGAKLTALLAGTAVSYVAVGLVAFHHLWSLWGYLWVNRQLSTGNSIDMTILVGESHVVLVAALFAAVLLVARFAMTRRSLFLPSAIMMILLLKLGFSRDDHYLAYFIIPATALAVTLTFDRSRAGRLAFVAVLTSLSVAAADGVFPGGPTHNTLATQTDFSKPYTARMQSVYPAFALDRATLDLIGRESVDVYPSNNEYALANGLNYVHRPLFQNYMTLTPALDDMNARFFSSSARPTFVLWTQGATGCPDPCNAFSDLDQKYTLNEDPLTTTSILRNYHLVSTTVVNGRSIAVLRANVGYVTPSRVSLVRQKMHFGRWYDVPSSARPGLTKVSPTFELTPYGRLKSLLFRGGIILVHYRTANGLESTYRLNTLNARSGVLASPLLDSLDFTGQRVRQILFQVISPRVWRPTFEADWFVVPDLTVVTRSEPMIPLGPISGIDHAPVRACDGSFDGVDDGSGQRGSPAELRTAGAVSIRGWLALSAPAGVPVDATYLTVTSPGGQMLAALPHDEQRPDLVAVFHHPELNTSGFRASFTLGTGTYVVGLAGEQGGHLFRCAQFNLTVRVS